MKYRPLVTAAVAVCFVAPASLQAQSRRDRVEDLQNALAQADNTTTRSAESHTATPRQLMRATLMEVDLDQIDARQALEIWSIQTGVPLVVNWAALENAGIDTEAPITLKLRRVPAEQALRLVLRQMNPAPLGDDELLLNSTEWYIQVLTKAEALQNTTTKMYFIGDLLMDIPNFEGPTFDLNEALRNTNSGGSSGGSGGGSGGSGIFDTDDDQDSGEESKSRDERAEDIAQIVRDTIEPDIWEANGGEYASIRYFRGMLVVNAPQYVHEMIGVPTSGGSERGTARRSSRRSDSRSNTRRSTRRGTRGVSGTNTEPRLVR